MQIRLATNDEQILDCYPVMAELRPHVAEDGFVERMRRQMGSHQYFLVSVTVEGKVSRLEPTRCVR